MDRSIARAAVNLNGSPAVGRDPVRFFRSQPFAKQEMVAAIFKILSKVIFQIKVNCALTGEKKNCCPRPPGGSSSQGHFR